MSESPPRSRSESDSETDSFSESEFDRRATEAAAASLHDPTGDPTESDIISLVSYMIQR